MAVLADPPISDSLIETDETSPQRRDPFYMAKAWIIWILQALMPRVQASPEVILVNKEYADQHAAIGTTALPTGVLAAGVYLLQYYLRVTTNDGVASAVQVTLHWIEDSGAAESLSGVNLNLDSTAVPQVGELRLTIGAATPLSFSTTYASTTPNKMRYKIQFTVIRVGTI
jgi:hypothetical protein